MKIYTRTGDEGKTSLIGGTRVSKSDLRIHAYGTVDELNAWIGLIRDQNIDHHSVTALIDIQEQLFVIGAHLATDPEKSRMTLPVLDDQGITRLEHDIDRMDQDLSKLNNFILPGGHPAVSYCHITRCVGRRAERFVVELSLNTPVDPRILTFLNRLSDYLFTLARWYSELLHVPETPWNPRNV